MSVCLLPRFPRAPVADPTGPFCRRDGRFHEGARHRPAGRWRVAGTCRPNGVKEELREVWAIPPLPKAIRAATGEARPAVCDRARRTAETLAFLSDLMRP